MRINDQDMAAVRNIVRNNPADAGTLTAVKNAVAQMNPEAAAASRGKLRPVAFSETQKMNEAQKKGAAQQVLQTYSSAGGRARQDGMPGAVINLKT